MGKIEPFSECHCDSGSDPGCHCPVADRLWPNRKRVGSSRQRRGAADSATCEADISDGPMKIQKEKYKYLYHCKNCDAADIPTKDAFCPKCELEIEWVELSK